MTLRLSELGTGSHESAHGSANVGVRGHVVACEVLVVAACCVVVVVGGYVEGLDWCAWSINLVLVGIEWTGGVEGRERGGEASPVAL